MKRNSPAPFALLSLAFTLAISLGMLTGCAKEKVEAKYPDGKPKVIRTYNPLSVVTPENLRRQQTFFFNGNKESDGYYRDGQLHGKFQDFWHNGQKKSEGEYKKGKKEGEWVFHYNEFTVSSKGRFRNDLREGEWNSYWQNGDLKSQGSFAAGKEIGTWKEWNAKGELLSENSCFESNPQGRFISFHANKTVKEEYQCRAGVPSGTYVKKDPDGVTIEKGAFDAQGRKDGLWETFHGNDKPASVKRYGGGIEKDSSFAWDEAGRLSEKAHFDSTGTGERISYDSLGHVLEKRRFLKGQPEGESWSYWPVGNPKAGPGPKRSVVTYKDGKPAEMRKWHPNGKPMAEGVFKDGHRAGEWKDWWENGALKEISRFEKGALHGERLFYDSTGKLMRTTRYEHGYPASGKIPKGMASDGKAGNGSDAVADTSAGKKGVK
jgi:antitoxin component YwqK of YwqJK toxin-antitoxin module